MKQLRRLLGNLVLVCLLITWIYPAVSYGASVSAISSVTIKVGLSDFDPGDTLPDITIGDKDSGGTAYVYASSAHYFIDKAEWVTSQNKEIQVGDTPRMKVWLEPTDYDTRRFKGGYQSSNVKVTGGIFKSASISNKKLVVTLELNPVKGQFESPDEAYWSGNSYGSARWRVMGSHSSYRYEVALYRGNSQVHKAETSGTSYNFYPYMTKKGNYYFKVRVIPSDSEEGKYGKASDWISSDEIYLPEENVSDGSGQNTSVDQWIISDGTGSGGMPPGATPGEGTSGAGGTSVSGGNIAVGWIQNGNRWYFRYPDGSSPVNGWLSWNGKKYLFDQTGCMLTGWQDYQGFTYYLDDSGAMVTGWVQAGNTLYYLSVAQDQFEGCLVRNSWILEEGNFYYLNQNGIRSEGWTEVEGNWYYFYPGTGIRAVNTVIDGFLLDENGVWHK